MSDHRQLTLDIGHALLEDLLESLGVLQLLLDLGDDALGQLLLLALLNLALVADPRVKHGLGLGSQSRLLVELVGLSLELGGLLQGVSTVTKDEETNAPWTRQTGSW